MKPRTVAPFALFLLLSGCYATVLRPGYACMRQGLSKELVAVEKEDPERFQTLLRARVDAGTCVALTPGERVRISDPLDRDWTGIQPPNGANGPLIFWTSAATLD